MLCFRSKVGGLSDYRTLKSMELENAGLSCQILPCSKLGNAGSASPYGILSTHSNSKTIKRRASILPRYRSCPVLLTCCGGSFWNINHRFLLIITSPDGRPSDIGGGNLEPVQGHRSSQYLSDRFMTLWPSLQKRHASRTANGGDILTNVSRE